MFTKSKIQQILEARKAKNQFIESLQYIMEKYNIEDSIFSYSGKLTEVTKGYFEINENYSSLQEAVNNYEPGMGIRIMNNKTFQLGNIHTFISECDKNKTIMDIDRYVNY